MAVFNWETWTDQGNVASTILDSLADATLSGASSAVANQTNQDTHMIVEINLGSITPTGTPYLELYMVRALDATNYEEAPVIGGTDRNTRIATLPVPTGAATKRVMSHIILIPPCPIKFYVGNQTNVTLAASGNTIDIYTGSLESV